MKKINNLGLLELYLKGYLANACIIGALAKNILSKNIYRGKWILKIQMAYNHITPLVKSKSPLPKR